MYEDDTGARNASGCPDPTYRDAARGADRVEYADGTAARRGDVVLDPRGRRLRVIGMDGSRGRLMTLDADCRMVGADAGSVEVVERS